METSIRFYHTNSSLRPFRDAERNNRPTSPLSEDEDSRAEIANADGTEVDTHPQLSVRLIERYGSPARCFICLVVSYRG